MGDTGMFLNNFIRWGDLVPDSPNCIAPHKKVDMCLSPMLVFRDGALFSALGYAGKLGDSTDICAIFDQCAGLRHEYTGGD